VFVLEQLFVDERLLCSIINLSINCYLCADQLSRLHMILKPFMLRRVKKDVENELSDKVNSSVLFHCKSLLRWLSKFCARLEF